MKEPGKIKNKKTQKTEEFFFHYLSLPKVEAKSNKNKQIIMDSKIYKNPQFRIYFKNFNLSLHRITFNKWMIKISCTIINFAKILDILELRMLFILELTLVPFLGREIPQGQQFWES